MATALKLRADIKKYEAALKSKATPQSLKAKLEKQLEKAKGDLADMRAKKPTEKKAKKGDLPKQFGAYKGSGVDIKKDSERPALPVGRRKSKSGNTYYEYRLNRIDIKQPPKKYPKLEKGGMMEDGGLVVKSDQDLREIAKYMAKAVKKRWDLKDLVYYFEQENNYDYKYRVKIWDEMNVWEMKKTEENIYKVLKAIVEANEKGGTMAEGGEIPEGYHQMPDGSIMADSAHMAKGGEIKKENLIEIYKELEKVPQDRNLHENSIEILIKYFGDNKDINSFKELKERRKDNTPDQWEVDKKMKSLYYKLDKKFLDNLRNYDLESLHHKLFTYKPNMASGGMMAKGGKINFKFKVGDIIKVPQYDGGKLKKLSAEIVETYSAKQNDGTYYPFYYVLGKWDNAKKTLYDEELILQYGNKPNPKLEDGGMMDDGGELHRMDEAKMADGGEMKTFNPSEFRNLLDKSVETLYMGLNEVEQAMRYLEVHNMGKKAYSIGERIGLPSLRDSIEYLDQALTNI